MGTNCGVLQVRLGEDVTRQAVIDAVVAVYVKAGATRGPDVHRRDLESLHVTQAAGRTDLGVAVSPEDEGWVTLIDSERYNADAALAKQLAKRLGTTVFWRITGDVSGSYLVTRYGPPFPANEVPGQFRTTYYDQLDSEPRGSEWHRLSFSNLPARRYLSSAPELPELTFRCGACREKSTWQVGNGNDVARDAEELPTSETTLLHAVSFGNCGEDVWLKLEVEQGVIVGARRAKTPPARPEPTAQPAPKPRSVAVWIDSGGRRAPASFKELVATDPAAALLGFARDERDRGLGLLKGVLEQNRTFGLMNGGELLRYWTRGELFGLFREVASENLLTATERASLDGVVADGAWSEISSVFQRLVPRLVARLEAEAGAPLVYGDQPDTATAMRGSFGSMRSYHSDE